MTEQQEETYTPRISTSVVPPDPNECMVEWAGSSGKYSFYIKLPRYIAQSIIADHTLVQRYREALESIRADNQHASRNWITANKALTQPEGERL